MKTTATNAVIAAIAATVIAACGDGETGGSGGAAGSGGSGGPQVCSDHPLDCPAGQTCWFTHDGAFTCQPSGPGKEGDSCAPVVGQPTCADGLLCVRETDMTGLCTRLCDPSSGDPACVNATCILVQTPDSGETHVCH